MSKSALATYTKLSPNCTKPRTAKIDTLTPHCVAGNLSIESTLGLSRFMTYDAVNGASCNYAIGTDGRTGCGVEEENRAWTTSSRANDMRAITFEIANNGGSPDWPMSDKAIDAFVALSVDICQRYGFKGVYYDPNKDAPHQGGSYMRITLHRWFANKACPGDYFVRKLPEIVEAINKKMGSSTGNTAPATTPSEGFAVGDVVNFTGATHYSSAKATTGSACKPGLAKVTSISASASHPYHLIAEKGGGSTVYGWVDATKVAAVVSEPAKSPEEITVEGAIKAGIITDRLHWLGVLTGTITPNKGNIKAMMDNANAKINK